MSRNRTKQETGDRPARGTARGGAWEWARSLLLALLLFLFIRTFIVEAFRIPTGSMERTLLVGDFLLVNKFIYGIRIPGTKTRILEFRKPSVGDVIVFRPPHEPDKNYVKRLVGVAGDTLWMEDKVLYRNGERVEEAYVQHVDPGHDIAAPVMSWQRGYLVAATDPGDYRASRDNWGPIVVPEGFVFALGDNRDDSEDSRFWGFVDASEIRGKPLFIYYSFDPNGTRPFPWVTHIRWDRIGSIIR